LKALQKRSELLSQLQLIEKKRSLWWDSFLYPLAKVNHFVTSSRRFFYAHDYFKQYFFRTPILSIGNITTGGTGKTPLTLYLASLFESWGLSPLILTRGHLSQLEKSHGLFSQKRANEEIPFLCKEPSAALGGDEPFLMYEMLKKTDIVIGRKRAHNLNFFFPYLRPDVVLLDDGHQHLQLHRRLNIVTFDMGLKKSDYRLLPLGKMRENWSALTSADIVVLTRMKFQTSDSELIYKKMSSHLGPNTIVVEGDLSQFVLKDSRHKVIDQEDLKNKKVFALAGLGNPMPFFNEVESMTVQAGGVFKGSHAFPDHFDWTETEYQKWASLGSEKDTVLITTIKDFVKMPKENNPFYVLHGQWEFSRGENEFLHRIKQLFPWIEVH
jgi:tetraacyldisaccharide 4'-kinase